jgi:uncharacterized protein YbjT (DUF2867 family)
VDGLFIVGPGSATDWSPRLSRLLAAAKTAGAGHAVLLSARAVEFLPGGAVDRAEQALRAGPLPRTDGLIAAPAGTGREPFIDATDIADVGAAVLSRDGYHGTTLDLSGPAAIGFAEAAAVLAEAAGTPVRYEDDSDGVQQVLGRPAPGLAAWAAREVPVAPWAREATAARG